ncbi:ALP1-like protein [Tanacetum coccineum]
MKHVMVFRECLEALIVCTGNGEIILLHGRDNTICGYAFFEMASVNNDINVLDNSSLFDDLLNDTTHVLPYEVNGVGYEKGYYLADGIYPQWATFVKSFTVANDAKHAYFKRRQEGAGKDAERAFGVLQGNLHSSTPNTTRWGIILTSSTCV